jgi:hypothetical protein
MDQKRTRIDELVWQLTDIKSAAARLDRESIVTEEIIKELEHLKKTRARACDLRKALNKATAKRWKWWTCC